MFDKQTACSSSSSSYLDMVWSHRDNTSVPPLGPQDVSGCDDPGIGQQGPRAKPAVLRNSRQIFHTQQHLPGEQTRLCAPTTNNPLHLRGENARWTAAGWGSNRKQTFKQKVYLGIRVIGKQMGN